MVDTQEILTAAGSLLGVDLTDPVDLGGSERSTVLRARAAEGPAPTVVVKKYGDDDGSFVRERAGLTLIDSTPTLLAVDEARQLVVMSDLGAAPTLADLLLGDDREAAWQGAVGWARGLGTIVGSSVGRLAEARRLLEKAPVRQATGVLAGSAGRLLDVAAPGADREAVLAEIKSLRYLIEPGPHDVLTPTDTCPDNAVLTADGWMFLDLEGTAVQHAAMTAAYAMLPFATCWCVFDPPPDLTDTLLAELTAGLAEQAPGVVTATWPDDVARACAAYVLFMSGWLMDSTLEGRAHVGPPGRSPSYRQLMTSRWRWAGLHLRGVMPATAQACTEAAAWAAQTWGAEAETTGYPAFAS